MLQTRGACHLGADHGDTHGRGRRRGQQACLHPCKWCTARTVLPKCLRRFCSPIIFYIFLYFFYLPFYFTFDVTFPYLPYNCMRLARVKRASLGMNELRQMESIAAYLVFRPSLIFHREIQLKQ